MTAQATKEQSSYRAAFQALSEQRLGHEPSWLARLRESALERFEEVASPTPDGEDWKYPGVAPFARGPSRASGGGLPPAPEGASVAPFATPGAARARLVFVNGVY